MDSKRIMDTSNHSENVSKSIQDGRVTSLFKKADELSILCDVEGAIIIFRPGNIQPIAWKSTSLAQNVLNRYLCFPELERLKRFDQHETYLQEKVDKKEEQINKLNQMNEEKEMELLFNQLMEGKSINELDAIQMKGLLKMCAAKATKLDERKKELNQPQNPLSNNENVTLLESPMEDLLNDQWFMESMAILGDGSGIEPAPTEGNDTNAEEDGHRKDLD